MIKSLLSRHVLRRNDKLGIATATLAAVLLASSASLAHARNDTLVRPFVILPAAQKDEPARDVGGLRDMLDPRIEIEA